ncbi:hydrolase [Sphingopyxis sp. Root214]|uniref:amidohydrolase family protein n=1 Tax=unclassified Sphingopyxis TaxID=2614943 RepID=UPI00070037F2|nr:MULTISPECIES: amidohydrolase family protein [unclassified Sphingopyxis]KQZ69039.1 hydrolase [Sphingopyxis sp. Root154]KRC10358.1 hydrolase [Sphingopyxis sp. Root214]
MTSVRSRPPALVAALQSLGLAASLMAAAPAHAAEQILYTNMSVIDGTGGPARAGQDILIDGERIVAVGAHDTLASRAATARRVDLTGRFVIPGLIDSHVHLATPPDRVRAEAILRRQLYGGVTAVRDMADDLRAVGELSRASLVGEIPAPDIYYAALMAGPSFFEDPRVLAVSRGFTPGTAPWMQAIDKKTELRTAVTLARGTSASAIKIYANLPAERVAAITAEAHRQKLMIWAHSAVFPARPAEVIAAGVDSVSHVCYLGYEAQPKMLASYQDRTPVDEARLAPTGEDPVVARLFDAMLRRGTILDATGSLFVKFEAARKADPKAKPLRCGGARTIRLTQQAWRAGLPISTGTDFVNPAGDAWPEVHAELRYLANDVGMPPLAVIHSATLVGARAAGQDKDMGSIEPGKLANFVILTADPLADIGNIERIEMTVKRGREYRRADYIAPTAKELGNDD